MFLSEKLRQIDQEITLYVTKRENLLLTSARMGKCWLLLLLLLLLFLIFSFRLFDYIRKVLWETQRGCYYDLPVRELR